MTRRASSRRRGEWSEEVDRSGDELEERGKELDERGEDVGTVRDLRESLEGAGTAEGAEEVENFVEGAQDMTVEAFDAKDQELGEVQEKTGELEDDIHEHVEAGEGDAEKINEAKDSVRTSEAVSELDRAGAAIIEDIQFLDRQRELAREAREASEQLQHELESRIQHKGKA